MKSIFFLSSSTSIAIAEKQHVQLERLFSLHMLFFYPRKCELQVVVACNYKYEYPLNKFQLFIKRKPLSDTTKRAGWIGCNIDLSNVAEAGKVFLIKDSKLIDKEIVETSFKKTLFLRQKSNESKGWILDVMNCIGSINTEKFTLDDVYKFEEKLKLKYPNNNFIKDKIRQQLQFLRDKGIIEFVGRGNYKKVNYGNI